jgi:hypothetical protein
MGRNLGDKHKRDTVSDILHHQQHPSLHSTDSKETHSQLSSTPLKYTRTANMFVNTAIRSVRAPLQAMGRRNLSIKAGSTHSNKTLAGVAAVSFVTGIDVSVAYYYFSNKSK